MTPATPVRSAFDAVASTAAPVCLADPACERAEPATVLAIFEAPGFLKVLLANDAIEGEVFLELFGIKEPVCLMKSN